MRNLALITAVCGAVLWAAPALANGRFPASGQVVVDPADPAHLVLRATFGILRSRDQGQSWGWICESAVGYGGVEDPMVGIAAEGGLLAAVFEGLARSPDDGCSWSFAGAPLAGQIAIDLSVRATDPHDVLVLASDGTSGQPGVYRSSDAGQTFAAHGPALPADFVALTPDAAPSAPATVYVSGRFGAPDYPGSLLRWTQGDAGWQRFDVTGADNRAAYIAAIAPDDPGKVYVRLDGVPGDELVVTPDGGQTWQSSFKAKGDLLAFALSPDGAQLVAGGESDGLWAASTSAPSFVQVSTITARCAAWTAAGLYACADEIADGYSLGLSTDGGATIEPVMHLASTCGPLDCAAATDVGQSCGSQWAIVAQKLGDPSCGRDAGGGGGGGAAPAPPSEPPPKGCGCGTSSASSAGEVGVMVAALLAFVRRRRR